MEDIIAEIQRQDRKLLNFPSQILYHPGLVFSAMFNEHCLHVLNQKIQSPVLPVPVIPPQLRLLAPVIRVLYLFSRPNIFCLDASIIPPYIDLLPLLLTPYVLRYGVCRLCQKVHLNPRRYGVEIVLVQHCPPRNSAPIMHVLCSPYPVDTVSAPCLRVSTWICM